ncbi:MAG: hypothetical protein KAI66_05240, partial [Lentisphaeria bacterium]|nr:hypothetical protein [Lentisphaeria bacterium]
MTEQPIYCRYAGFALIVLCLTLAVSWAGEAPTEILLKNPGFEEGTGPDGVPVGWLGYLSPAGADPGVELRIVPSAPGQGKALLIRDDHPDKEIGIRQTVKVKPNTWYEVSVDVRADHGAMADGSHLLLEFGPTYKLDRAYLTTEEDKTYTRFRAIGKSPPDATRATIVLYTHRLPTPRLVLDNVKLIENAPPPLAPIKPVSKIYTQLKDLCLQTRLVTDGKPNAAIVVPATGRYTTQATRIAACLRTLTGVDLPIVTDDAPEAAVPVQQHLILLGNRSTNRTIEELYNQHYTLLDLRYPGPGGHLVRTLHNPFGNQCNVIFVGGSDDAGVAAATEVFEDQLQDIGAATGQCVVGRLAEIQLATGITVPTDVRELRIWEASKGYRDTGYFGWNSISKHMAAYYMTG